MTTNELNSLTVGTFLEYLQKNNLTDTDMLIYIREKANRDPQILESILAKVELDLDLFTILWDGPEVPYLKTNLKELKSVIVSELSIRVHTKTTTEKTFADMIEHKDKTEVLKKLHEWLSGAKPKKVATVIKALIKTKMLSISIKSDLYKAMRNEFPNMKGTDSGLNKFLANDKSIPSQETDPFVKTLENI